MTTRSDLPVTPVAAPSRYRLRRLRLILQATRGIDNLEQHLADIGVPDADRNTYLNALCDSWIGHPGPPRFDKGKRRGTHSTDYHMECLCCRGEFWSKRVDALYCGNACRQQNYRKERTA